MRAISLKNQAEEGKAAQHAGATEMRVRKFFTPVLLAVIAFLSLRGASEAAELKKFTLGYSTVGPAGTGLWIAKEIGAFGKYGCAVISALRVNAPMRMLVDLAELGIRYSNMLKASQK